MRAITFIMLFLSIATGATVYNHYAVHGVLNWIYVAIAFFMVLNLLICYWELCLLAQPQKIADDTAAFHQEFPDNRNQPALDLMLSKIELFSTAYWSKVWSSYAIFDGSYADKRTFGYNADIGNGMFTLIPSLLLHVAFTYHFLPANILGIISLCFFYQVTYMTGLYWVSFFVAGRQKLNTGMENLIYIAGTNSPWFIFGLLGIYASVRLILDNNYSVFGLA